MQRCRWAVVIGGLAAGCLLALLLERDRKSLGPSARQEGGRHVREEPVILTPGQRPVTEHTFSVANPFWRTAELTIVARSCGCIDPRLDKPRLARGQAARLTVRVPLVAKRYRAVEWVLLRMVAGDGEIEERRYVVEVPVVPRVTFRLPAYPELTLPVEEGQRRLEDVAVEILVYYRRGERIGEGTPFLRGEGIQAVFYQPPATERDMWLEQVYRFAWRGRLSIEVGSSQPEVRSIRYGFGKWTGEAVLRLVRHRNLLFSPATLVYGRSANRGDQRTVWLVAQGAVFTLRRIDPPSWLEVDSDAKAAKAPQRRVRLRLRLLERPPAGRYELKATVQRQGVTKTDTLTLELVVL